MRAYRICYILGFETCNYCFTAAQLLLLLLLSVLQFRLSLL